MDSSIARKRGLPKWAYYFIAGTLLVGFAFLGYLWWLENYHFIALEWETTPPGLRLYHVPAKGITSITVEDAYTPATARHWTLSYPNFLREWRAEDAPPPEQLVGEAHLDSRQSTVVGLLIIYGELTDQQKKEAQAILADRYAEDPEARKKIEEFRATTAPPWLESLLAD